MSDKTRKRVGGVGRVESCVSQETGGERSGPEKKKRMTKRALRWQLVDGLVLLSMHTD